MNKNSITEVKPHITTVTGASGPVPVDALTTDTTLKVIGNAAPGAELDIWDGLLSVAKARATSLSAWEVQLTGLAPTLHSITAMNVGGQLISDPWPFEVRGNTKGSSEDFEGEPSDRLIEASYTCKSGVIVTPLTEMSLKLSSNTTPFPSGRSLEFTSSGELEVVQINLPNAALYTSFDWSYRPVLSGGLCLINYYNSAARLIGSIGHELLPLPDAEVVKTSFTAPPGETVAWF
ncbi:hypothetical protein [Pseudomonas sp. ICMP 561]|uniref:hypothetical protein n=1 Tax=Pseudomonas sp. ICMP 561 TaxID=1718918 RepID=UPI000C070F85|nr:hypothetical protein [Pseudomonas sp. ICMP 561]PHN31617.1 hypothetical protein AO242_15200 [Pseudomonas sp. ICMP 561]